MRRIREERVRSAFCRMAEIGLRISWEVTSFERGGGVSTAVVQQSKRLDERSTNEHF